MSERKRDWDTVTGWEKRIKVDYGSIGPNHVRWSDWTYKERDIVARKVHESAFINKEYGPRSRKMEEWAKEHAPIMIDFARDGKPMPDWAHADYRPSGIPEHVEVVWKRDTPDDTLSKGDWAYNPPGPWDEGEEPAWSSKPKDPEYTGSMHSKYGGVISYRTAANGDHIASDGTVISTAESRAKEDVPDWRKFELGRLEEVDGVIVPGPNALPKDEARYGDNIKLTKRHKPRTTLDKIMPDDPNYSALEKALNWAAETHHGAAHQDRWNRVAAALGADNGFTPMTGKELGEHWENFNHNKRWSMALTAFRQLGREKRGRVDAEENPREVGDVSEEEAPPPLPTVEGEWRLKPMESYGTTPPAPGSTGWYTRQKKWLPKWYWDLQELTFEEGEALGMTSRASVAPFHYIFHKKGKGILGRQKTSEERTDLPLWTYDYAMAYYRKRGIRFRACCWLDGHLMTRKGFTHNGVHSGDPIARRADEDEENNHKIVALPTYIAEYIEDHNWQKVIEWAIAHANSAGADYFPDILSQVKQLVEMKGEEG